MVAVKAISPLSRALRPQNNIVSFPRNNPPSVKPGIQEVTSGGLPLRTTSLVNAPPMPGTVPPRPTFVPIGSNVYVGRIPAARPLDENELPPLKLRGAVDFFKDECNAGISFSVDDLPPLQLLYRNPQCDFKPAEPLPPMPSSGVKLKLPELEPGEIYLIAIEQTSGKFQGKVIELNCSAVNFSIGKIEQTFNAHSLYQDQPYPYSSHPSNALNIPSRPLYIDIYPASARNADDMRPIGQIRGMAHSNPVVLFSGRGDLLQMYFEGNIKINTWGIRQDTRSPTALLRPPDPIWEFRAITGQNGYIISNKIERITNLKTCKKIRVGPAPILKPPPPPPPTKEDELTCCPTKPNNSDQLLKLLLLRVGDFPRNVKLQESISGNAGGSGTTEVQEQTRRVSSVGEALSLSIERTEKVGKAVGVEAFPVTAPVTLMGKPEGVSGEFDFIESEKEKKVNNLAEFMAWQTEQISDLLGS